MECELFGQLALLGGIFHCTLFVAAVSDEKRELRRIQVSDIDQRFIGRLHGSVIAASRPEYFWGKAKSQRKSIMVSPADYL
jgi:hypothetical protein